MEDKYAAFLAALAGLADSPTPSTRDEALLKSIADRLSEIAAAASTPELPAVASTDKDKFLHTAAADGALEWAAGGGSSVLITSIGGDGYTDKNALELYNAFKAGTTVLLFNDSAGAKYSICESFLRSAEEGSVSYEAVFHQNALIGSADDEGLTYAD